MYNQPSVSRSSTNVKKQKVPYTPKCLPRQRHVGTRIDVQLIRTRVPAPLIRRNIRFAEIGGARRRTRINDLHRDTVSYPANRAPYTTSVRHRVAFATVAGWATWARPACGWALAATLRGVDAARAFSARDIRGQVGGSGAVSTALS